MTSLVERQPARGDQFSNRCRLRFHAKQRITQKEIMPTNFEDLIWFEVA